MTFVTPKSLRSEKPTVWAKQTNLRCAMQMCSGFSFGLAEMHDFSVQISQSSVGYLYGGITKNAVFRRLCQRDFSRVSLFSVSKSARKKVFVAKSAGLVKTHIFEDSILCCTQAET